jgi:hypothetical protein
MTAFAPKTIRYIKLGQGGKWARRSLEHGEIHFGYSAVPHDLCLSGDWDGVVRHLEGEGRTAGKAKDMTREIRDFYTLGSDCLWITLADGHLWWAFAEPEVVWLGPSSEDRGARLRRTLGPWRNTDRRGRSLRLDELSTRLTRVGAYRQTICSVEAFDYLVRRINGIEEPILVRAREARTAMIGAAEAMIAGLHWADFETLVDLIFAASGWRRLSRVGGPQKDIDLVLEEPASGQTAFVQVKSRADRAVLDDYVERFAAAGVHDRLFFVCHTPVGDLDRPENDKVHIWTRARLAETAIRAGLYDWLMEKTG